MKSERTEWILLVRSLLIQGSWNYRTLLGSGVAWALLPFRAGGGEGDDKERVARAGRTFNTHPYLAPLALGALLRLERDGVDPGRMERFQDAIRGPLGSLGDGLIWAAWRPVCLLAALLWAMLGGGVGWVALGFLLVYNVVHLGLRAWGARVGLGRGFAVGEALRDLNIPRWTERIATLGVLLVGLLAGILVGRGVGALPSAGLWIAVGAGCLFAGILGGASLGRWAPGALLLLIIIGLLGGTIAPMGG